MTTFVLVHGAWHGGWCWRFVAPILRRAAAARAVGPRQARAYRFCETPREPASLRLLHAAHPPRKSGHACARAEDLRLLLVAPDRQLRRLRREISQRSRVELLRTEDRARLHDSRTRGRGDDPARIGVAAPAI